MVAASTLTKKYGRNQGLLIIIVELATRTYEALNHFSHVFSVRTCEHMSPQKKRSIVKRLLDPVPVHSTV